MAYISNEEYWAKRDRDRNSELEVLGELQNDRDREERVVTRDR